MVVGDEHVIDADLIEPGCVEVLFRKSRIPSGDVVKGRLSNAIGVREVLQAITLGLYGLQHCVLAMVGLTPLKALIERPDPKIDDSPAAQDNGGDRGGIKDQQSLQKRVARRP